MNKLIPDIRFYDFSGKNFASTGNYFDLLHVENHFISSNWNIHYNDVGNFEAHFDLGSDTLPIIMDNDYLVAVQGSQAAIIIGKKTGEDLAVFGRTCNWLLKKRVTEAFSTTGQESVYNLVKRKVESAFNDSPVQIENISFSVPAINVQRSDNCITFDFVQECLEQNSLGHEMTFDFPNQKWLFRLLKGKDNSLVISTANRNAYDVTMTGDSLDFCTEGLYKSKMSNGEYEWLPIYKQTPQTSILRWVTLLNGENASEARASLDKARCVNEINGKTIDVSFGNDYSLGDIVSVEWQSGRYKKRTKKRIVGVNLWYENGNIGEEPLFENFEG